MPPKHALAPEPAALTVLETLDPQDFGYTDDRHGMLYVKMSGNPTHHLAPNEAYEFRRDGELVGYLTGGQTLSGSIGQLLDAHGLSSPEHYRGTSNTGGLLLQTAAAQVIGDPRHYEIRLVENPPYVGLSPDYAPALKQAADPKPETPAPEVASAAPSTAAKAEALEPVAAPGDPIKLKTEKPVPEPTAKPATATAEESKQTPPTAEQQAISGGVALAALLAKAFSKAVPDTSKIAAAKLVAAEIATDSTLKAMRQLKAMPQYIDLQKQIQARAQQNGLPEASILREMSPTGRHADLGNALRDRIANDSEFGGTYSAVQEQIKQQNEAWTEAAAAVKEANGSPKALWNSAEPANRTLRAEAETIPDPSGNGSLADSIKKWLEALKELLRSLFQLGPSEGERPAPAASKTP